MADIFISYAKADRVYAAKLAAMLEANGYTTWWDSGLLSGDDFRKVIMQELGRARACIVLWSKNSINSDWVRSEAGRGQADRKLIPVKFPAVTYKDIPPPFDVLHTENVEDAAKILAAVVAQLVKPEASMPIMDAITKMGKYQFMSFAGVVGGGISLFSNMDAFFRLSQWAQWLIITWLGWIEIPWHYVLNFFGWHLSIVLMHDATFMCFIALSSAGSQIASMHAFALPHFHFRASSLIRAVIAGIVYIGLPMVVGAIVRNALPVDWRSFIAEHQQLYASLLFIVKVIAAVLILVWSWPVAARLSTVAAITLIAYAWFRGVRAKYGVHELALSGTERYAETAIIIVGAGIAVSVAAPRQYSSVLHLTEDSQVAANQSVCGYETG